MAQGEGQRREVHHARVAAARHEHDAQRLQKLPGAQRAGSAGQVGLRVLPVPQQAGMAGHEARERRRLAQGR